VQVKICQGPDGQESFLLCRSAARIEKEQAIHERFGARIEMGLGALGRRIAKAKRPLDRGALERQIGRLLERNHRAAAAYAITFNEDACPAGVKLTWSKRDQWHDWAALSEGTYILRTNVTDWSGCGPVTALATALPVRLT
jgi:hypothetical protein